ncbi:glycosyltransferase family 2 protein [Candidatus Oscillochloris fontis]|uniref:glycosyltransferase family 2 protein n=1 Tax=Candidatus Oscillochloris fontis TaxID=2496868 RepID=UPI001EE9333D|nr:glycosyltransferase family A protein [Candidatus Oscillochloris fontis]
MDRQIIPVPDHAEPAASDQPLVMVLICTRNRGAAIRATIRSVLANTYVHFNVLIIDQSNELSTASTVAEFCSDSRLRYIHTATQGLSTARNIGLAFCHSDLVLMTDDDCEVPPNWIAEMVAPFLRYPHLGVTFCDVIAGPHDPHTGYVPICISPQARLIEDVTDWHTCDGVNVGIGAGLAIRRSVAEAIGGFDVRFGPGGHFRNGDDLDVTLRALIAGYPIYRLNHVGVIHHGFRTFAENRILMRNSMFSVGAAYGRLICSGHWRLLRPYMAMLIAMILIPIIESLRHRRLPPVLGRIIWLIRGTIEGGLLAFQFPSHTRRSFESLRL